MEQINDLTPQKPAKGIYINKEYPGWKWYSIPCDCGCEKTVDFSVEVDEYSITASLSGITKTAHWHQRLHIDGSESYFVWRAKEIVNDWYNRLDICWNALVHGYMSTSTDIMLTRQQALNVSDTLKTAIEEFEKKVKISEPVEKE